MAIDVRAAILSVYYRAESPHPAPPPGMPSLEDSAVVIRNDAVHGGHAESRRRHAIARLAAADVDAHEAVLTALGAPVDAIRNALANQPGLDESHRQQVVNNLLNGAGPAVAGCEVKDQHTDVELDPTTNITTATVTLSVNRPMADLALVMDPQGWVKCSDYFKNSYVARKDGNDYRWDKDYNGYPLPNPPRRGAPWRGVLFEHFELPPELGASWFRNFLVIDASPKAGCVKYRLYRSIRSRVGCEPATGIDGGITHDAGYTQAKREPDGWTSLKAVKEIRFSDRDAYPGLDLNFWARVLLNAMGDEAADGVCCTERT